MSPQETTPASQGDMCRIKYLFWPLFAAKVMSSIFVDFSLPPFCLYFYPAIASHKPTRMQSKVGGYIMHICCKVTVYCHCRCNIDHTWCNTIDRQEIRCIIVIYWYSYINLKHIQGPCYTSQVVTLECDIISKYIRVV